MCNALRPASASPTCSALQPLAPTRRWRMSRPDQLSAADSYPPAGGACPCMRACTLARGSLSAAAAMGMCFFVCARACTHAVGSVCPPSPPPLCMHAHTCAYAQVEICDMAGHAVVYKFDLVARGWAKMDVEGSLFVVRRMSGYRIIVLNRSGIEVRVCVVYVRARTWQWWPSSESEPYTA
eukprot:Tamp_15186.p1 GENE.Tamp_15186~~Tamp_15186.p1  ORF type:complete len:181 (-),score=17.16 Tamp_15186:146-688(-)